MTGWRTKLSDFFQDLRRRKILRAAASYAIVAWLLLQIGEVTFEPLGIPRWGMSFLIVLLATLFPLVLLVSWFFDMTPQGLVPDSSAEQATSTALVNQMSSDRVANKSSIAVLPFKDISIHQDQAYFCDGIAEEILNRFAKLGNLRVVSRTSSFRYRDMPISATKIGQELRVATVLEGSVRKSGDRLRIAAQLVNVSDGFQLWSETYDHKLEDVFDIQANIASQVAKALEITLVRAGSVGCRATGDARAYDYYLKGQYYFRRWGTRNFDFAIQMFEKAVGIDPGYARAWAALAESYAMVCMYWNPSEEKLSAVKRASAKALELSPALAESHVARGLSHFVHGERSAAMAEFETARHLEPEMFDAWYFCGRVCFQYGDLKTAAGMFERAEKLNPDDFQAPILLRQIYRSLGRDREAREAARRGVERARRHLDLHPDDTRALNLALGGLAELGHTDEVRKFADRTLEIDGENPDTLYNVACGYALIGDTERAIEYLEHASLCGIAIADWAENDSDLVSIKNLPRFQKFVRSLRQAENGRGAQSKSKGVIK